MDKRQIRLACLHPATIFASIYTNIREVLSSYNTNNLSKSLIIPPSDTLALIIETFDLDCRPEYIALSYVWGEECAPTFSIKLNGVRYNIRENLYVILNYWRSGLRGCEFQYFWVDQLCINQANPKERNHQVGLMSSIYGGCRFVVAWLGRGPRALADAYSLIDPHSLTEDEWQERFDTVSNLLYWNRLWVVQEYLLAPEVRFYCGRVDLSDEELSGDLRISQGAKLREGSCRTAIRHIALKHMYISLQYAVAMNCWKLCTDPRDKVYGLLGIVGEKERLKVDYTKSVEEVFIGAMFKMYDHIPEQWIHWPEDELHSRFQITCLELAKNMLPHRHGLNDWVKTLLSAITGGFLTEESSRLYAVGEGYHCPGHSEEEVEDNTQLVLNLWAGP